MEQPEPKTIIFRCPPELEGILPRPIPAVRGLPDWFKALPQQASGQAAGDRLFTIKKCPPVIDAMTYGFLMPLACDVTIRDGEFSWDRDVPAAIANYPRSPIDFHDPAQVAGTPFFDEDRFVIKFNSFWTIELPEGYSLLVMHPVNRLDLPFVTLTGLVDADRYRDNFINFPARWRDPGFNGVLPKGTPLAQVIPVKREEWTARCESIDEEGARRMHEVQWVLANERDVYRREYRAAKR
jgi:hypothetical protein